MQKSKEIGAIDDPVLLHASKVWLDQPLPAPRERITHVAPEPGAARHDGRIGNELAVERGGAVGSDLEIERQDLQGLRDSRRHSSLSPLIGSHLFQVMLGDGPAAVRFALDANARRPDGFQATQMDFGDDDSRGRIVPEMDVETLTAAVCGGGSIASSLPIST